MGVGERHETQQPEWAAQATGAGLQLLSRRRTAAVEHAGGTCRTLNEPPRRYCSLVAAVDQLTVEQGRLRILWHADTYCRQIRNGTPALLGWNVVLTLQGGDQVVTVQRSPELSFGGRWTVSAAETVTPEDLPEGRPERGVDMAALTARTLEEELGVTAARPAIAGASTLLGAFRFGGSVGVVVSVDGDLLHITASSLQDSWSQAESAWEGVPQVEAARTALQDRQRSWVPWAKGCIAAATGRPRGSW